METIFHYWTVPFLTLVVALIPLTTKLFDQHPMVKSAIIVVVLTLLFIIQPVQGMQDAKEQNQREADTTAQLLRANATIDALNVKVSTVDAHQQTGFEDIKSTLLRTLRERGFSQVTVASIADSTRAATYLNALKRNESSTTQRSRIEITYYPKAVDKTIVFANLRGLGYRLSAGVASLPDVPTNAIWAGADVSVDDVRAIALTLRQAGVAFQSIERFCQATGDKARLVEIGSKLSARRLPVLDAGQLKSLSALPTDGEC